MHSDLTGHHVLVLGGTGAIGSAVLRVLAKREVEASFTYFTQTDKARALSDEYGHKHFRVDLGVAATVREFLQSLETQPNVVIHCAAVSGSQTIDDIDDVTWRRTLDINATSAFLVAQYLAQHSKTGADVVLVGALDRTQSLPLPVHYAASQGMLSAMTMALAHELGPKGFRVNMIALGVMESGVSASLAMERRKDYEKFSALRRVGSPEEAARAICWLALDNSYMNGKVVPVNGGI